MTTLFLSSLLRCNGCFALVAILCPTSFSAIAGGQKRCWQPECSSLRRLAKTGRSRGHQPQRPKGAPSGKKALPVGPASEQRRWDTIFQVFDEDQKGAGVLLSSGSLLDTQLNIRARFGNSHFPCLCLWGIYLSLADQLLSP